MPVMPTADGDLVLASVTLPDRLDRGIRILRADPRIRVSGSSLLGEDLAPGVTVESQTLRIEDMDGRTVAYRLSEYDAFQDAWTADLTEDRQPTTAA